MPHNCSRQDARFVHASLYDALDHFQGRLSPVIGKLVAGQIGLPPWIHNQNLPNDENLQFLKSLNLPAASRFNRGQPSLLLHELGCLGGDPDYKSYIAQVFQPGVHTLLVNTSGAGKTRILLEGLCQHWGFYFSAQGPGGFASTSLGSLDLRDTIYTRLPNSPHFNESLGPLKTASTNVLESVLEENRNIAGHLFQAVLLARLVLLDQYLAIMNSQGLRATNDLKHRWLLLQIDPWILDEGDVFDALVDIILSQHANATQMQKLISIYWCSIFSALDEAGQTQNHSGNTLNIFLVVDEAQDAVEKFSDAFRSAGDKIPRPVLRELINRWFNTVINSNKHRSVPCTFVITGTGILRETMEKALSSSFFKGRPLALAHTTGGLDTREAQSKYIKKYLPERFLASPQGRVLLERLWYWLSGRFRFTAEYIALLIQDGLRRPHRLLNKYIEYFTRIKPTDYTSVVRDEKSDSELPLVCYERLQFKKLLDPDRREMLGTVKTLVFNYFRRSIHPSSAQALGEDESLFVQYGIARYRTRADSDSDRAEICEPLIFLATAVWLDGVQETLHKCLCDELGSNWTRKNGFEDYLAYYFTRAFGNPEGTPLDSVFKFNEKDRCLSGLKASLVSVHRDVEEGILDFSDIEFGNKMIANSLSGCLGENAESQEDLEDWVRLQTHTPFCFPPNAMGPDILFVLRLHKRPRVFRYLWVAVQAKYIFGGKNPTRFVKTSKLKEILSTVTPNQFYLNKKDSKLADDDEGGETSTQEAASDDEGDDEENKELASERDAFFDEDVEGWDSSMTGTSTFGPGGGLNEGGATAENKAGKLNKRAAAAAAVLEALDALPDRETRLAGRHSVLRVLAVFPTDVDTLEHVADPDESDRPHPIAILKHKDLMSRFSKEHPTEKLQSIKRDFLLDVAKREAANQPQLRITRTKRASLMALKFPPRGCGFDAIQELTAKEVEEYIDCFRLLLGKTDLPASRQGNRQYKGTRDPLLYDLLREHYQGGGESSVAKAYAARQRRVPPRTDADGDTYMEG